MVTRRARATGSRDFFAASDRPSTAANHHIPVSSYGPLRGYGCSPSQLFACFPCVMIIAACVLRGQVHFSRVHSLQPWVAVQHAADKTGMCPCICNFTRMLRSQKAVGQHTFPGSGVSSCDVTRCVHKVLPGLIPGTSVTAVEVPLLEILLHLTSDPIPALCEVRFWPLD